MGYPKLGVNYIKLNLDKSIIGCKSIIKGYLGSISYFYICPKKELKIVPLKEYHKQEIVLKLKLILKSGS